MASIKNYLPLAFLLFAFASCGNIEIGESKDVNQECIYQDYRINYTEGQNDDQVEVWTQFRFAGDEETTLVLNKPSSISFDGITIGVDSNDYMGAFYQLKLPAKNFFGNHRFSFTDINNKKFENDFAFDCFRLTDVPATASKAGSLILKFETSALQEQDYIELSTVDTDSGFAVKHLAADSGNFITIPASELKRQKVNELSLSVAVYREIPLMQKTKEGGKIVLIHTLKPVIIRLFDNTAYACVSNINGWAYPLFSERNQD